MVVLSFLFPIVGIIYWFVKKNENPEKAQKCIKWAGYGVILNIAIRAISRMMG